VDDQTAQIAIAAFADAEQKIYDAKVADIKPEEEIHARHILVATEAEAKEVKERLMKGEDLATVAKEKSKDPSAEGGDLGFFGRGKMLKPFEDAAIALKDGEISDPVQTQFGWHIIKVERDGPIRCRPSIRSKTPSSASFRRRRLTRSSKNYTTPPRSKSLIPISRNQWTPPLRKTSSRRISASRAQRVANLRDK
jgi:hypothetical protein